MNNVGLRVHTEMEGQSRGTKEEKNEMLMGLFTFRLLMITFSPFDGFWFSPDRLERTCDFDVVVAAFGLKQNI